MVLGFMELQLRIGIRTTGFGSRRIWDWDYYMGCVGHLFGPRNLLSLLHLLLPSMRCKRKFFDRIPRIEAVLREHSHSQCCTAFQHITTPSRKW